MRVLLYGIGRQRLTLPSGAVLDLRPDREWRKLVTTLRAQVAAHRPPLLREHDDGDPAIGYVDAALPVSREQLVRAGVPASTLPHPDYVMFRCALTARGAKEYKGGDVSRTSIGLLFDVTDEQGRRWPYYLEELSAVDKPHVRTQPTAAELSRVALRTGQHRAGVRLSVSGAITTKPRRAPMDAKEMFTRIQQAMTDIAAEFIGEAPAAEATEATDDVLDELMGAEPVAAEAEHDEEKEELAARVKALEAKLAAQAEAANRLRMSAAIDKSGVAVSAEERAALVALGCKDPEGLKVALRLAAKSSGTSVRLAAGGGPVAEPKDRQEEINQRLSRILATNKEG